MRDDESLLKEVTRRSFPFRLDFARLVRDKTRNGWSVRYIEHR